MPGAAADRFVSRAFEALLKECGSKKYNALQSAIRAYLERRKDINQQSDIGETNVPAESDSGAEKAEMGSEQMQPSSRPANSSGSIVTVLANTGHALGEAELVLNPLRLAFETKNIKLVELALDCLHKLMEYNHLEGNPGLEGGKNSKILMDILQMVCSCADNSAPDSTTLQVLKVLVIAVASPKMQVHGEPLLGIIRACYNISLNSKSPISHATSKAMLTQMLRIIFRRVETDLGSSSSPEHKEAHFEDGSNSMIEGSPGDHTDSNNILDNVLFVKQRSKTSLAAFVGTKILVGGDDIKALEAILQRAVKCEDDEEVSREIGQEGMSVEQRDALCIFCMLCKMGMMVGNDAVTIKTQILSLELLQDLLEDVGQLFARNIKFIDSTRAHLSYALLRASLSQSPILFQHASGIFSLILLQLRKSLKAEIGVLFPLIVLRTLDGSDLNQKLSVLRSLKKVFKDPHMLVDLYINYDCDLEAQSLFVRMVATLSKLAQATQKIDPKSSTASLTASIKMSSLEGLVNVLKSLGIWEKFIRKSEKQTDSKEFFEREISSREFDESKFGEDSPDGFEKFQARETTVEAVVCEAMIADYLGQQEEFPAAVMNSYVESFSFSGMRFDIAMREFFKDVQPPAEALKIDYIMEQFAARYCEENPDVFKTADAAYTLAYAIIILNADAHDPMVHPKMSEGCFVNINTTSNEEESALQELLKEVYDSIVKEGIELKYAPDGKFKNRWQKQSVEGRNSLMDILNLSLPKRSSSTSVKFDSEAIIKQIQALIKDEAGNKVLFYTSDRVELLYPMVEAVGWPLLASSAVIMSEVDNKQKLSILLDGFKEAIHITNVLGMNTIRYAFLTALLRYNSLHAPKDIRDKNVEALRALLALCNTDIYALKGSWFAFLECISRLEFLISCPAMTATVMQDPNQIARDAVLQSLRELSGRSTEQVFLNSIKLPSESVVEFFTALCSVSMEELKQSPPRMFSLMKIVEVSYYNMARIRLVWARIWCILVQHFIFAGSHADENVAISSIDSLQKLVMKYLEHDELANFSFQNGILNPLVVLMQNRKTETIQKHTLDSSVQIVKSMAESLRSGWLSIFIIFSTAAANGLEPIVEQAFENAEQAVLEHFDQVMGYCFIACANCLMEFANNKTSQGVSLKAVALLRICANRLVENLVQGGPFKHTDTAADEACGVTEQYWFPILAGLSDLTSDTRLEVGNCAIEVLFDLMSRRGNTFSSSFWEKIFLQVLFPIFDCVRQYGKENVIYSRDEWHHGSCMQALQLICNLFSTFYKDVSFMLSPFLSLLLDCTKKTDQSVVSASLGALAHLIEVAGQQFSDHDWDTLLKTIRDASYTMQPLELLNDLGFDTKHHNISSRDSDAASLKNIVGGNAPDENQETACRADTVKSEATRTNDHEDLRGSQILGQEIYGNVKEMQLVKSSTSKPKNITFDATGPSSPSKFSYSTMNLETRDEMESPMLRTVRGKCMAQLLLLGVIDSTQKKYWNKLSAQHKISIMEIVGSVLEFATSYNSCANLRLRMHQIPAEIPPLNLLRLEFSGTCIYLDILQKTTATDIPKEDAIREDKIQGIAEEKLVSFCEHVLREASDFQSSMEEITDTSMHRVLELRSPIIIKVLKGMCQMKHEIFKNHLRDFYPLIAKLVSCEQMEIRGALSDLFSMQLGRLLM